MGSCCSHEEDVPCEWGTLDSETYKGTYYEKDGLKICVRCSYPIERHNFYRRN